jgi:dipeptidyl-peptidase-4
VGAGFAQLADAVKQGAITPEWSADSKSFDYTLDGKRLRFDVKTRAVNEPVGSLATPSTSASAGVSGAAAAPAGGLVLARGRGREADVMSPDGKTRAISRDRNIWLVPVDGGPEVQLTTDGSDSGRIRHGVGSYVYLEEFSVSQPVWWSPDGKEAGVDAV